METLKKLYNIRDEIFSEKTYEIFEQIDSTLACVTLFLTDTDDIVAQGIIAWEDTSLIGDFIYVMGTVQYNIGDVLTINEKNVEITLDNINEYERVVHMSIPYELVIEGDKDNIIEFLYTADAEVIMPPDFMVDTPTTPADFDLSELSPAQLKALMKSPPSDRNN